MVNREAEVMYSLPETGIPKNMKYPSSGIPKSVGLWNLIRQLKP